MKKTAVGMLLFSLAVIFPASMFAATSGADLFKTKCALCHGARGNGKTPVGERQKLRDLASAEVQKLSDADLTAMIAEGGLARKPAHAFKNKGLTVEQVRLLVSFIRSLPAAK